MCDGGEKHAYRVGSHSLERDDMPMDPTRFEQLAAKARKEIESWLSAVFQAEHLNLLIGSGFTTAIAAKAKVAAATLFPWGLDQGVRKPRMRRGEASPSA